jgi:hypothetical protein
MSQSKFLRVSSTDRSFSNPNESNGNFTVFPIARIEMGQIKKVQVYSCLIPNVFYNIRSSQGQINNTLNLTLGVTNYTVTLPEGQYVLSTTPSATEFKTQLQAVINTAIAPATVVITQDVLTKKLIFTFSTPATILLSSLMSGVIGYTADQPQALVLTMDGLPNLTGYEQLYIHSSTLARMLYLDSKDGGINVICGVNMTEAPFGSYAYLQNNDRALSEYEYYSPSTLDRIDIRLRDVYGNILDPGTYNICLVLKCLYD